jgi:DNA repair protein RecN (Recombination protein N)
MVHSLAVSNYALLEQVHLELGPGMTVLTGETGSGKSILLGALGLALGDRADASVIRPGAARCTVEATFDATGHTEWLEAQGFESAGPLVLRREIAAAGRSRAFINDTPCSVADLREIGIRCVDLHGQDETRALAERTTRLNLLDRCAGNAPEVAAYRAAFAAWQEMRTALDRAEQEASAPNSITSASTQWTCPRLKANAAGSSTPLSTAGHSCMLQRCSKATTVRKAASTSSPPPQRRCRVSRDFPRQRS